MVPTLQYDVVMECAISPGQRSDLQNARKIRLGKSSTVENI